MQRDEWQIGTCCSAGVTSGLAHKRSCPIKVTSQTTAPGPPCSLAQLQVLQPAWKGTLLQLKTYSDTSHRNSLMQSSLLLAASNDNIGLMCRENTAISLATWLDLMP